MQSFEQLNPYRASPQVPCPLDRAKVIYEHALRNSIRLEIAENIVTGVMALYLQTLIHEGSFTSKTLYQSATLLIAGLLHSIKKHHVRTKRRELNENVHHAETQEDMTDIVSQEIDKSGNNSPAKIALLMALAPVVLRFFWAHNNWADEKLSLALNLDLIAILGFSIATWINDKQLKQSSRSLIEVITKGEKTRVVEAVRVDTTSSEQAEDAHLADDIKIRYLAA